MKGMADMLRKRGNRRLDEHTLARIEKHTDKMAKLGKMFGRWMKQQKVVGGPDNLSVSDS